MIGSNKSIYSTAGIYPTVTPEQQKFQFGIDNHSLFQTENNKRDPKTSGKSKKSQWKITNH